MTRGSGAIITPPGLIKSVQNVTAQIASGTSSNVTISSVNTNYAGVIALSVHQSVRTTNLAVRAKLTGFTFRIIARPFLEQYF
jgi:hypothetical protein